MLLSGFWISLRNRQENCSDANCSRTQAFSFAKEVKNQAFLQFQMKVAIWFMAKGLVLRAGGTRPLQWSLLACDMSDCLQGLKKKSD